MLDINIWKLTVFIFNLVSQHGNTVGSLHLFLSLKWIRPQFIAPIMLKTYFRTSIKYCLTLTSSLEVMLLIYTGNTFGSISSVVKYSFSVCSFDQNIFVSILLFSVSVLFSVIPSYGSNIREARKWILVAFRSLKHKGECWLFPLLYIISSLPKDETHFIFSIFPSWVQQWIKIKYES